MLSRRTFLRGVGAGAALGLLHCDSREQAPVVPYGVSDGGPAAARSVAFPTRGVVVTPEDLTLDWPARARAAGLTTVALHTSRPNGVMVPFVASDAGKAFLDECAALGIAVEYEMHAVSDLLPRNLFASRPELFRMDKNCERNPDGNLCVHNLDALDIAAEHAVALCKVLRSTTDRYFLWPDDYGLAWCECPCCAPLSASDQSLTLENHLLTALRAEFPYATVAHLAYSGTIIAPVEVKARPGVFLEFCPFYRRYDIPFDTPDDPNQMQHLERLDANLAVFGSAGAQALEFWLDDSRISGWKKPAKMLPPWDDALFRSDVATYRDRGVLSITSFAVFLDADYVAMYGEPPIDAYGAGLRG